MSTNTERPATYGGWQAERMGVIGNLSGVGFTLVAAAAVISLAPIYQRSWSALLIALPLSALLLGLAYGRVLGLTADEWLLLAVRHQISVATKKNLFLSGAFAPRNPKTGDQPMDLPGPLARLRILDAADGQGGQIGVVLDPSANTYTAVARITFPGLALIDNERQNARVAGWAAFLRAQCKEDSPIVRIAVHQRSLPDDGAALRAFTARHTAEGAPDVAKESLAELMMSAGPVATIRETYLAISLSAGRARLAIKGAGGGQIGAAAVLVRELNAMQGSLSSAGLQVTEWLTPRKVAQVIRTAYDPHSQLEFADRNAAARDADWQGTPPGVDPALAGPSAAETGWSVYRHDGAYTVSYQVRNWPQSDVFATFMQPLLRPRQNARRSLSLVFEPIGPSVARRELAKEKTKRDTARKVRAKTGRSESEDERREAVTAREQDRARAAGHGVARFTGLIAVTVTDYEQLETACAELQADASAAGIEVRRMWGGMDAGFAAAALPLAVGLPERRIF
ncbi:SCO6880 family protein [Streptomyces virginiae]|uniref:SCO6880 family protein n=1 Tax=Streptomyces virginiae TaxID=1961 RepID=UPI00225A8D13|nr:SCO6880 family protein [Streptomyces virginiae]MCX5278076.1 type VII secretion protein EccE [Streptomyces virginiae]